MREMPRRSAGTARRTHSARSSRSSRSSAWSRPSSQSAMTLSSARASGVRGSDGVLRPAADPSSLRSRLPRAPLRAIRVLARPSCSPRWLARPLCRGR
jgi:hypothetical protein